MEIEIDSSPTIIEEKMLPFLQSAKVSSMSIDDVERDFQSHISSGLVSSEAERRKRIYGLNEFDVGPDTPLWRKYVDQVSNVCIHSDKRGFKRGTSNLYTVKNVS